MAHDAARDGRVESTPPKNNGKGEKARAGVSTHGEGSDSPRRPKTTRAVEPPCTEPVGEAGTGHPNDEVKRSDQPLETPVRRGASASSATVIAGKNSKPLRAVEGVEASPLNLGQTKLTNPKTAPVAGGESKEVRDSGSSTSAEEKSGRRVRFAEPPPGSAGPSPRRAGMDANSGGTDQKWFSLLGKVDGSFRRKQSIPEANHRDDSSEEKGQERSESEVASVVGANFDSSAESKLELSEEGGRNSCKTDMPDRIYMLSSSEEKALPDVYPPEQVFLVTGERADYLPEFTRAVGGDVTIKRRGHTARVQQFAGGKATRTFATQALLDTGSPASFLREQVWKRMLASGAASIDGLSEVPVKTWGGFHGVPLKTHQRVRLNLQMWKGGKDAPAKVGSPTAQIATFAYLVPEGVMSHDVLLGRNSLSAFPVRKYRDVSATETIVTFVTKEGVAQQDRFSEWKNNPVGMIEPEGEKQVLVRSVCENHWLPKQISWVAVEVTKTDGTAAEEGLYYASFGEKWFPQEALVQAGKSEIPLQRATGRRHFLRKGDALGSAGPPLQTCSLEDAKLEREKSVPVNPVMESDEPKNVPPPPDVLKNLGPEQAEAFKKLWQDLPPHMKSINFDFENEMWKATDIKKLSELLGEFEHRFSKDSTDLGRVTVEPFKITLRKDAAPVRQRPYRYSPAITSKVNAEIDKLLAAKILRRSYSDWASPLVVVAKANGAVRLTVNYRRVNAQSVIPTLPLPCIDDILNELGSSKVFSVMDLISGFFQCSIEESSIPLTAVITSRGLYEFCVMPMGLAASPGFFQQIMNRVCEGLDRIRLFIDDIICYSRDGAQHVEDLSGFFERLTKFDLKLAPRKAFIGVRRIKFLGHRVTSRGLEPCPEKVEALLQMPMPTSVSALRSVIGGLSYYRRYLPRLSAILKPITALLKKGVKFEFTSENEGILRKLLQQLASPLVLAFPDYPAAVSGERPFRLVCDASCDGLGAVIEQQQQDGTIQPLSFLSRTTLPNERAWSATELECGAMVWAIKKNRHLFYGIPFQVVSDHQPLRNMASLATKNNRVQRWFDFLSAYQYEIVYRPGTANSNADMMSRLPLPATEDDLSPDVRLTEPEDQDVYFVGASGVSRMSSSLGGLAGSEDRENFGLGGVVDARAAASDELSTKQRSVKTWQQVQALGGLERAEEVPVYAVKDDSPLVEPDGRTVCGQWQSGIIFDACPLTEQGRELLGMVAPVAQAEDGGDGGVEESKGNGGPEPESLEQELPELDFDSLEAKKFGEHLCSKTPKEWSIAQRNDDTARSVIAIIRAKTPSDKINLDALPEGVDSIEVKRLVAQGEVKMLTETDPLLVRRPTKEPSRAQRNPGQYERLLGDEPVRVYVPLLIRPWAMDHTHKEAVHLGEKVTLALLQRYYWWIGMAESVKWWVRRCYFCMGRKTPRQTVMWPLVSLPLPGGPGEMVSFDYLGKLPKTQKGNEYVFLIVDLFSRHAEGYAITAAEKSAKGCAYILVNSYIPRWGTPHTFLSDRGAEFTNDVCRNVFRMLGAVKKFTSSMHPQTNGMVERLNHTLCQMLSYLVVDNQTDWDEMLPHAVSAHNNNVSRGTGLAPNQVHIGRYPRLPLTILEGRGARGHQGLRADQREYLDLMFDRQKRAYQLVREEDQITKAKHRQNNEELDDVLHKRPKFEAGDWVFVYDDRSTIAGGGKAVLKAPIDGSSRKSFALSAKLATCWTGPYKVLSVGPKEGPDDKRVGPNLLLLDVRKEDMTSSTISERVSVYRCKKCTSPHEGQEGPRFLPWGLSNYVLNQYSERSPPFHLTAEDVRGLDTHRLEPLNISMHRLCRGLGGKIAVQYYTHWSGVEKTTWEEEAELKQYGNLVMRYWIGSPVQSGAENAKYRKLRILRAKREEARERGSRFVAAGHFLCCDTRARPKIFTNDVVGSYVYYKTDAAGWQLARVTHVAEDAESVAEPHTVKMLDLGVQVNVRLDPERLTTDNMEQTEGTWCWHVHTRTGNCKTLM